MNPDFRNCPKPELATIFPGEARAQASFEAGLALHQQGQLAQAKASYEQVLLTTPAMSGGICGFGY